MCLYVDGCTVNGEMSLDRKVIDTSDSKEKCSIYFAADHTHTYTHTTSNIDDNSMYPCATPNTLNQAPPLYPIQFVFNSG